MDADGHWDTERLAVPVSPLASAATSFRRLSSVRQVMLKYDDSPDFWKFINAQIAEVEGLRDKALRPAKLLEKFYVDGDDESIQSVTEGWSNYRKFLSHIGDDMKEFEKFAGLLSSLGGIRSMLDRDVDAKFVQPLKTFAKKEYDQVIGNRKSYEDFNSPFLADAKKFVQTKRDAADAEALKEQEKKLKMQRAFLELARFDIHSRVEILDESIFSNALRPLYECLQSHWEFFSSGYHLMERFKSNIDALRDLVETRERELQQLDAATHQRRRQVEKDTAKKSESVQLTNAQLSSTGIRDVDGSSSDLVDDLDSPCKGYLYVSDGNSSQNSRTWCCIEDGLLTVDQKRNPPLQLDLLLCTVREAREANVLYCFQVISPQHKLTFQALSRRDMHCWMTAIQIGISDKLQQQQSKQTAKHQSTSSRMLSELREVDGNRYCADCHSPGPDWISKNLGILICCECSGNHRSLGTHISKVRSLQLDDIDDYLNSYMMAVGNARSNRIWLSALPPETPPPSPDDPRDIKSTWIEAKYKGHFLLKRDLNPQQVNDRLFKAIAAGDLLKALESIAWGADVNFANVMEEMRTPLHQAADKNYADICIMLIENGASVQAIEARGWTPLHYAVYRDNEMTTELLLTRGSNMNQVDYSGLDAVSLAKEYECTTVYPLLTHARDLKAIRRRASAERRIASGLPASTNPVKVSDVDSTGGDNNRRSSSSTASALRRKFKGFFRPGGTVGGGGNGNTASS